MDSNVQRSSQLLEFEGVFDEGYWWDEVSTYFFRASSSPRKDSTLNAVRNAPATSFDDFQQSVNDAWDLGDDEFCVISGSLFSCIYCSKFIIFILNTLKQMLKFQKKWLNQQLQVLLIVTEHKVRTKYLLSTYHQ